MYDVTEPKTLDSLSQWKSDFIDQVGIEEEDEFAFIVVGNKVDLEATRQVQRSKGEQVARELGAVAHFETSAKTAHNVEKTFHMAASTALKRTAQRKPYVVYEILLETLFPFHAPFDPSRPLILTTCYSPSSTPIKPNISGDTMLGSSKTQEDSGPCC